MSSRRRNEVKSREELAFESVPQDVPSLVDIKRKLPSKFFQPNLILSFYYVVKDFVIVGLLYASVLLVEHYAPSAWLKLGYLPIYWYVQGTMFWALFVLGHDCGHGSFSKSTLLNDIVGNLLHSLILVPYYPWKVSHQHHHKNTGNIDRDEIFYPVRESEKRKEFLPLFGFGLSWFFYLFVGYSPRPSKHLNPYDPLFARNFLNCSISLALCTAWVSLGLVPYAYTFGLVKLTVHYLVPIFFFASWLVVTTFLHHQDELVPWYADPKWNFVKGQLSSVDRHYGWAHTLVHNIGTHQIHHLFSKIPHYYLEEATVIFRKEYPHLVRKSDEPILSAFYKMFHIFNEQHKIKNDTEVHVYKGDTKSK
uniref:Methyl-end desaturase n=1 Tax=Platychelipus littoralis TaxID=2593136 RepID=A0A9E8LRC9_9MAXI|nr:methyl-end desaturase [Platychelipus littoralis]